MANSMLWGSVWILKSQICNSQCGVVKQGSGGHFYYRSSCLLQAPSSVAFSFVARNPGEVLCAQKKTSRGKIPNCSFVSLFGCVAGRYTS